MSQLDDLQAFVNVELPRRGATLTAALVGYDGDPNDGGAPAILQNAPIGTRYIQATGPVEWVKLTSGSATWTETGGGGGGGIANEIRTLYVGKHGDNGNQGLNISNAFLTVGAAITAAISLTPTSGSPVVIRILDSGTYSETITLPPYVSLDGPNAHLTYSAASTDVVRADTDCFVRLGKISCGGSNGYCITSEPDAVGEMVFDIGELVPIGSGRLLGNRSTDALIKARVDLVRVIGVNRGGFESASNAPMILDIQKILLCNNSAYGLLNLHSVPIKGRIGSIEKESPGLTGTVGMVGGVNPFSLVCGRIQADTAIDTFGGQVMSVVAGLVEGVISVAGTLYLTVGRHIGTVTETGTLYMAEANGSFNRGLGIWGVTPPSSQPAKISDPTDLASALTAIASIIDVLEGSGLSST